MAVALKDVAQKAGVSLATASMAIRGHGRVSSQTCLRVKKVAGDLGFRPSASARALARGRADMLGVAIRDLAYMGGAYVGSVVAGITEVADTHNMGLSFTRSIPKAGSDPEYVRFAKEGRFDGMVLVDQAVQASELSILAEMTLPVVLVDRRGPGRMFPAVRVDYRAAVREAASHLISLGHQRLAVMTPDASLFDLQEKMEGYKEALEAHNIPFDRNLIKTYAADNMNIDGLKRCIEDLEGLPACPTAYMSFQDCNISNMCELLMMRGLRIPKDISVIGFNSAGPGFFNLVVDAIKVPCREMGNRACQLLLDMVHGRPAPRETILDATFEPQNSCGPPGR